MTRRSIALLGLLALTACTSQGIVRSYVSYDAAYATFITIPECHSTIRLSGVVSDSMGDTEAQTESVLRKISRTLVEAGVSEADVVAMTVYLVAPEAGAPMDFAGMMRAYSRHYGSFSQPNRPVGSTVQVAGLTAPGLLVEIEVTATRPSC